jgi:Bacterial protein of unknown function (DUF885)
MILSELAATGRIFCSVVLLSWIVPPVGAPAQSDTLDKLANDFWAWRSKNAPFTGDDVNRMERPGGIRDWSRASIDQRGKDLAGFEARWKKLNPAQWPIPKQVDYKLIGSALSRVHWELEVNPRWKRDPNFYIEQTLTALAEALTIPAPYDEARSREILTLIENISSILQQGSENLENPPAPFASVAVQNLDGIRERLHKMASALVASTNLKQEKLNAATNRAADALERFQQQLKDKLPKLPEQTALGRDAYIWFLRNVALMPFTPDELLAMGRQEWNRAVAFEAYEKNRNKDVPPLKIATATNKWIKDAAEKELQIRKFLEERGILTVPKWVQHYTFRPTTEYLRALEFTEHDDFTSPSRLNENCIRYVPEPSEKLGYFWRATAVDSRPITVHEGVPGHYFQLCLSWKNDNPIRRHYYDSGANEGIGFYAEEMMLQAGLFDDSPHTREIIYNFMRLRALRVEVDVKLALGEFTLEQAAKYLQEKVPMDEQTARQEAIAFSTSPGGAMTYQIGKLQILKFLADARMQQGDKFNLRAFHDFVWKNGNVPIALQQWEYLTGRYGWYSAGQSPNQTSCLTSKLIPDLEPHLPCGAGDGAETGFVITRVQVFALGVDDVHHLFASDLSNFGLVRLFRTRRNVRGLLEQNGGWRALGDERERFVLKDSDHHRKNITGLLLCGGVKFLAERHDVNAAWTQRGTYRRCRIGLSCRNLEFDMCDYFFGHGNSLIVKSLNRKSKDYPRSTCQYSSSTGVARPKMVTETRNLPRSGSISSTTPV